MGWSEVSDQIDADKVWQETQCTTFKMFVVTVSPKRLKLH